MTAAKAGAIPRHRPRGRLRAVPSPQDRLTQAIAGMEPEHLHCRDFGHGWQPWTARRVPGGYESVLRCARCLTVRVRKIGMRGQVLSTSYDYPDGYQVKGLGQLTGTDRDKVRLASLLALLPDGGTA